MDPQNEDKNEKASLKYPIRNMAYNNLNRKLYNSSKLTNSSRDKSN